MADFGNPLTLIIHADNFLNGLTAETHFTYIRNSALILDTPGHDLVQAWLDGPQNEFVATYHGNYNITQFRVFDNVQRATIHVEAADNLSGALTGDQNPMAIAGLLNYRTARLDKSGRGRSFLFPANEAANGSGGTPTGAYQSVMRDLADAIMVIGDDITSAAYTLCVWSNRRQQKNDVTSVEVSGSWASQRERRR